MMWAHDPIDCRHCGEGLRPRGWEGLVALAVVAALLWMGAP